MRFYASGTFQEVCGDLQNILQPSQIRIVYKVSRVLAAQRAQFIRFPDGDEAEGVKNNFRNMHGLPQVIGWMYRVHALPYSKSGRRKQRTV